MKNYYILSVDSLLDSFSVADAAEELRLSIKTQNGGDILTPFQDGDQVLIYRRLPIGSVGVLLEVKSAAGGQPLGGQLSGGQLWEEIFAGARSPAGQFPAGQCTFIKKLEVARGVKAGDIAVEEDLERTDIVRIPEEVFRNVCRRMVEGFLSEEPPAEEEDVARVTGGENILLYGVPGAGKSHEIRQNYCDDPDRMERVVFHPDYSYSDFVGQILPGIKGDKLKYEFTPGPFTNVMKKAWDNPDKEIYLVIEEINRGNAPAIFGELFQLLDRKTEENGYLPRECGESEYGVVNYDIAGKVYGDEGREVRIPSNLWILATMNTADQNVFTLDTAFQRRWDMRHIRNDVMAAVHAHEKIEGSEIAWGAFALVINDLAVQIGSDMVSSEDKRLGAYFVRRSELSGRRFPEKVLKYLWDDAFKMDRFKVFQERFLSLDAVIEEYERSPSDKLEAVLRSEVFRKMREMMRKENRSGEDSAV